MAKYCLICGNPLQERILEDRPRMVCPSCGWVHYTHLKVSAGALVEDSGKILLVQRSIDPWRGSWYLPAGYLEDDEDPILGAEREVREETGLDIKVHTLLSVSMYADDPRGNGILILYEASKVAGKLACSNESQNVAFFTPEQAKELPLAGGSHDRMVMEWVARQNGSERKSLGSHNME